MDGSELEKEIALAVRHFWRTRRAQKSKQDESGRADQGSRGAATGGSQMDGFIGLFKRIILAAGIAESSIYLNSSVELPGYFRPTKEWDLLVIKDGQLVLALEAKSQVGSFGNNFNNRVEEALGSAEDLWTAFREGRFNSGHEPWLGWMLLLEDSPKSRKPVRVEEPHFPVFREFVGASYADRYRIFCRKLVLERKYRSACLVLSSQIGGSEGLYTSDGEEASIRSFIGSLSAHVRGWITH